MIEVTKKYISTYQKNPHYNFSVVIDSHKIKK